MRLTRDETRALTFIVLLLALAAAARLAGRDAPIPIDSPALDVDTLAAAARAAQAEEERRARPLAAGERIDPNTAPAVELDRLPNIGPTVADRIIAERERGGAYRSVAGLAERVAGIGEKTADRLAPLLTLTGFPPAAAAGRRPLQPDSVLLDDRRRAGAAEREPEPTVDLNRATAADLERLRGIGPVLARRILAYRDSVGGFASVDEIERVSGIGPRTLERLRPRLHVRP